MIIGPDGSAWGGAWYAVKDENGKDISWHENIRNAFAALRCDYTIHYMNDDGETDEIDRPTLLCLLEAEEELAEENKEPVSESDGELVPEPVGEFVEPNKSEPQLPGIKYDDGKVRFDLLPWDVLEEVGKVLTYGAKKYREHNWKKVPDGPKRYEAALLRHLAAYKRGELKDQEGIRHLAAVVVNAMFLCWFDIHDLINPWED